MLTSNVVLGDVWTHSSFPKYSPKRFRYAILSTLCDVLVRCTICIRNYIINNMRTKQDFIFVCVLESDRIQHSIYLYLIISSFFLSNLSGNHNYKIRVVFIFCFPLSRFLLALSIKWLSQLDISLFVSYSSIIRKRIS